MVRSETHHRGTFFAVDMNGRVLNGHYGTGYLTFSQIPRRKFNRVLINAAYRNYICTRGRG